MSHLSLRTRSKEMIIFVRGNFCAARSISAWKFSKQVSADDFSMSLVPVWMISGDGAPRLWLVIASMAEKMVGAKICYMIFPCENLSFSMNLPFESMSRTISGAWGVSLGSCSWLLLESKVSSKGLQFFESVIEYSLPVRLSGWMGVWWEDAVSGGWLTRLSGGWLSWSSVDQAHAIVQLTKTTSKNIWICSKKHT